MNRWALIIGAIVLGIGTVAALVGYSHATSVTTDHTYAPMASASSGKLGVPVAGWQLPYAPNPFVTALCSSDPCWPPLDANSTSQVSEMFTKVGGFSLGMVQEAQPGTDGHGQVDTFPIYYSKQSDPSYTVTCTMYSHCPFYAGAVIHIPNGAHASIDSDHHMSVIERWTTPPTEYDFWKFNDNGTGVGTTDPVFGGGHVSTAFGDKCVPSAYLNKGRCLGSAVAAAVAVQPGLIDPREWINGRIAHTIYVAIPCPSPLWVWPAADSDGSCATGPRDGEYIWLDLPDAKINALAVHPWVKTLLHAMHDYGLMVVDSSGPGAPWNLYGLDSATTTSFGQLAPWTAFFSMVASQGDGGLIHYAANASHLQIPAAGITQSNIHIVK